MITESILQTEKGTCFVCQRQGAMEVHHIFFRGKKPKDIR